MHKRLNKIEQHPAVQEAKQREYFVRLLRMGSKELRRHFDAMPIEQLEAFVAFAGPDSDIMDEIDLDAVPDVALDAFIDGDLTWEELKERYPAQEVQP